MRVKGGGAALGLSSLLTRHSFTVKPSCQRLHTVSLPAADRAVSVEALSRLSFLGLVLANVYCGTFGCIPAVR
jgi:hypothetical protein